jgi:hypothetical protein
MTEFPALVYKATGKHVRPNGTYDFTGVVDAEDLSKKVADGWYPSLEAAVEALKSKTFAKIPVSEAAEPVSEPVVDDNAPPTRQELEAKAAELGIKFDGRYSDKRIASLIEEALK